MLVSPLLELGDSRIPEATPRRTRSRQVGVAAPADPSMPQAETSPLPITDIYLSPNVRRKTNRQPATQNLVTSFYSPQETTCTMSGSAPKYGLGTPVNISQLTESPPAYPACGHVSLTWMACSSTRRTNTPISRMPFLRNTESLRFPGPLRPNCRVVLSQMYARPAFNFPVTCFSHSSIAFIRHLT